jgi:8-hydroxy-5-deazaflavin:NADPH oxidoreductase
MDIAIIGTGNVGRVLASAAVRADHNVVLSAAHPESARTVAEEIGARAADSNRAAVESAEVVILAVPAPSVAPVFDEVFKFLEGKIIVDVTNPMTPDAYGPALEGGSGAELIQSLAPDAFVVKAFNTLFASLLANPVIDGIQLDGLYASDHDQAKAAALELVQAVGLRPIDAGALIMARTLEAMMLLNISLQVRNGWSWQNAWKLLGPTGA